MRFVTGPISLGLPALADVQHVVAAVAVERGDVAAQDLPHAARHLAALAAGQPRHEGRHVGRVVHVEALFRGLHGVREGALGHARARDGADGVGRDAVAPELRALHQRERGDAGLGGRVGALPHAAQHTRAGAGVDDARVHLVAGLHLVTPVGGRVARQAEVPLEVHVHHRVPLLFAAAHEHAVAHEAGVVHHHVQPPEGGHGLVHQRLGLCPVGHVGAVGKRLAAHGLDGAHHLGGRALVAALAVVGGAQVVDHHLGALTRQLERVLTADAAPCARDDDHATFTDSTHVLALSFKRKSAVTRGR
jgi:hypothetical protein